jgi:membrane protease YdiL (CAAX protease family)
METKTDIGAVPTILICACVLFFPFLWGLFSKAGRVTVYLSVLLLIAALHVPLMRKGFLRLGPVLLFDIIYLLYPYCLWQAQALSYTFPGILYAVPVLAYLGIVLVVRPLRGSVTWLSVGRIDAVTVSLVLTVSCLSAVGLIGWVAATRPDLDEFLSFLPPYPPLLLALGGLIFALSNGVVEELIFRGALWDALRGTLQPVIATVLVQAALFGLWHWKGFPGGPTGMALVFVWGLFLGWIRSRSKGMLAPFICHVCADLTIFSILSILARR